MERSKEDALRTAHSLVDEAMKDAEGLQAEWCEALFYQVLSLSIQEEKRESVKRHNALVQHTQQHAQRKETPE